MMQPDKTRHCPLCDHELPNNGSIKFDIESGIIVCGGLFASLTSAEADLFLVLWDARPRVLSQERLMSLLYWQKLGGDDVDKKIIDVEICKIRKKIKGMPFQIETAWGRGYFIKEAPAHE